MKVAATVGQAWTMGARVLYSVQPAQQPAGAETIEEAESLGQTQEIDLFPEP